MPHEDPRSSPLARSPSLGPIHTGQGNPRKAPRRRKVRSSRTNAWVRYGPFELYVRKGHHIVGGQVRKTFDLANFSNTKRKERGKGAFRLFIASLPFLLKGHFDVIYVESVQNPRLAKSLPSMGFKLAMPLDPPSFYLEIPREN